MFRKLILIFLPLMFIIQCSLPEPDDYVAPVTVVIYPYDDAVVSSNMLQVRVEATDDEKVKRVTVFLDGSDVGTATSKPYLIDVDISDKKDNLEHVIRAAATDDSDNTGYSPEVRFTIARSDDITPPSVVLLYPVAGSELTGTVEVAADVNDDTGVSHVEFYIDGVLTNTDNSKPYGFSWDTSGLASGSEHTLYAKAYDAAGNIGTSGILTVTKL